MDRAPLPLLPWLPLPQKCKGAAGNSGYRIAQIRHRDFYSRMFLARAWGGRYHAQDQPRVLENKIEGNKLRDKRNKEKLRKMGWSVITVWECQLKSAVRQQTLLEIEYYINHTYLERFRSRPSMFYEIPEDKDPPGVVTEGEAEYGKRWFILNRWGYCFVLI